MGNFKIYKEVATLPATLTPNSVYLVRTGTGFDLWATGSGGIALPLNIPTYTPVKRPLYERRDIWAEEGGATGAVTAEWSFGNGATGFMGLVIDDGWEVEAMYFMADTYAATATITVEMMNYGNTPSNAAGNAIAAISLASSTDGGGQTDNAYKYQTFATPPAIPTTGGSTVIGFLTRAETGNISDARVGARLRRQIDEFVADITVS